ncbi:MAG: amidohydrolase family protein [Verrucomicrobiota bacterium]
MMLDSHQHFWQLSRGDYDWLTPELTPLYRDFLPEDLLPKLEASGVTETILVQAAATVAETEFMLSLAEQNDFISGVVGWVNFGEAVATAEIERLAAHSKLVGFRPMIQDIPDKDWMLRPQNERAYQCLIEQNLVFDALVLPQHLKNLHTLANRFPDLSVVIDHGAKPPIREAIPDSWFHEMASLAEMPQINCKVSGLVTEASDNWKPEDLQSVIQHLLSSFGPERLLWGSDWPVLEMAGTYEQWFGVARTAFADLPESEQAAIFGNNARRIYLKR